MQAISTKYLSTTITKPDRIKARHNGGIKTFVISKDAANDAISKELEPMEITDERLHRWVAAKLMAALKWDHLRLPEGGALDSGYVFVPVAK